MDIRSNQSKSKKSAKRLKVADSKPADEQLCLKSSSSSVGSKINQIRPVAGDKMHEGPGVIPQTEKDLIESQSSLNLVSPGEHPVGYLQSQVDALMAGAEPQSMFNSQVVR